MALPEAAVGAIVSELLRAVLEIRGNIEEYDTILERIEKTLRQIEPIVKKIDNLNAKLDRKGEQTKVLWEEIKKRKELINCCKSEIGSCCSCFKKQQYQYLGRLQELDKSLNSFFNIVVSLQTLMEVTETKEAVKNTEITIEKAHEKLENMDQRLELIHKQFLEKNHNNNTVANTGSKSPEQRKQAPGAYGRANSKGKDNGGFATPSAPAVLPPSPAKGIESPGLNGSHPTGELAAAPTPYPVPRKSGSALDERPPDQTKMIDSKAHIVPPQYPSPAPKSPEVVKETKWNVPAQSFQLKPIDSLRHQPNVQVEPRHEVKQAPQKVKEVPREPAYSYIPDEKSKVGIRTMVSDDSIKGASFGKDSPSGRYSSQPDKTPKDGSSSSYGFGVLLKSPQMKGISIIQDRAATATTTTDLTSTRPYIPLESPSSAKDINSRSPSHFNFTQRTDSSYGFFPYHQPASAPPKPETKTVFVKDQSGYSSPGERRSIPTGTGSDNPLTRSYPQPTLPKMKEIGYNQGNQVSWQSNSTQNTIGRVSSSNYAPLEKKATPNNASEIKKGGGKELKWHKSMDNREDWSSDDNDE